MKRSWEQELLAAHQSSASWEKIASGSNRRVERLAVSGGHLYLVETQNRWAICFAAAPAPKPKPEKAVCALISALIPPTPPPPTKKPVGRPRKQRS